MGSKKFNIHQIIKSFWSKVDKTSNCWNWRGSKTWSGYGILWSNGDIKRAHRFSYELVSSKIPKGLQIDHLCRNRACVNPEHLEVVTNKQNTLRGVGLTAINARKTYCIRNHPFSGKNLYSPKDGSRQCRKCRADYGKNYKRKSRAKK